MQDGKKFSIDSIEVEPLPVDHSLPGVDAFILHTSAGSIANTGDLRFHGRREKDTPVLDQLPNIVLSFSQPDKMTSVYPDHELDIHKLPALWSH